MCLCQCEFMYYSYILYAVGMWVEYLHVFFYVSSSYVSVIYKECHKIFIVMNLNICGFYLDVGAAGNANIVTCWSDYRRGLDW